MDYWCDGHFMWCKSLTHTFSLVTGRPHKMRSAEQLDAARAQLGRVGGSRWGWVLQIKFPCHAWAAPGGVGFFT